MESEDIEKIDFKFKWNPEDYDKIAPNVLNIAKKLLELNLVKVEPKLDEDGCIVIWHAGVCNRRGLVDMLSTGLVKNDIYWCKYRLSSKGSLDSTCASGQNSKRHYCQASSCPIGIAGYLYYLKYKSDVDENARDKFLNKTTEKEVYEKNYNELKKLELDSEVEELLKPLAMPYINGLSCAFIGEEGTNKESIIRKVANYLYRIEKIASINEKNVDLASENFDLEDEKLYVISDLQEYLDKFENNDDFSNSAQAGRKINKNNINKILSQYRSKYIIINATPIEFKRLIRTNSKLKYIFDNVIYFKDYSDEKILEIFKQNLSSYHKKLFSDKEKQEFLKYLDTNRKYFPFKNNELALFLASYVSKKDKIQLPKGKEREKSVEEMLSDLVGMKNVKMQLKELRNFLIMQKELEKMGKKVPDFNLNMMFIGNPGTGKTTVSRIVSKILFELGYIKEDKCIEVDSKELIAAYTGQTALKTGRVIDSALGGVLFIDEAYSLTERDSSYGKEVISTLVKAMDDNKRDLVVIFAGYSKEMQEFIASNSGIQSRIGYTFEFADYTEDELYEIFELKSKKIGFTITKDAEKKLREILNFGRNRKNFGNGRYVDIILQKTLTKKAKDSSEEERILTINAENVPTIEEILTQASGERKLDEINGLFEEIVGMEDIKKQIISLGKYIKFRNKISKNAKNTLPEMRLHMVFEGDSGTGKTIMARKVTQMLYDIGCIRINKLVEVDRKDLVAEYVGQTAVKTEKVIEGALGGVLFIDEAYSLTSSSSDDFGNEAISTLIKAMEDYKDELVVIFAGYKKEMKKFMQSNSGIASRIGYTFNFKNYKTDELYKIFEIKCNQYSLKITKDVEKKVKEVIQFFSSVENFGNGRFVDKLLQETLINHSANEKLNEYLDTIFPEDVPTIEDMVKKTYNKEQNYALPSEIDDESRKWTAIHEIGHAIVEYLHNGETTLKYITIVPEGNGTLGYVIHGAIKEKNHYTKRDYLDMIDVSLAGRAAEEIIYGKVSSGCFDDIKSATSIVTEMLEVCGMSETLGLISLRDEKVSSKMHDELDEEKKKILESCYNETKKMIGYNRKLFNKVLNILLEKKSMSGDEFITLLKE